MKTRHARQIRRGLDEARREAATLSSTLYWEDGIPRLTRLAYYRAMERFFPGRFAEPKLPSIPAPVLPDSGAST